MFLSRGFRPFFLLALSWGMLALVLWLLLLNGHIDAPQLQIEPALWHGRAMIFAYGAAVICGFLLTAASNWSGLPTLTGKPLLWIALAWLLARAGPWIGPPVGWQLAVLGDIIFWSGFIIGLSRPLRATGDSRNFWTFVPKLVLFALAATIFDLAVLLPRIASWQPSLLLLGLLMIVAIVIAMGIRVIPFFITRALQKELPPHHFGVAEVIDLIAMTGFVFGLVFWPDNPALTLSAVVAVVVNGQRLWSWYDPEIWRRPMLWTLFLGFASLLLGILLLGLTAMGWVPYYPALHALGYGGIGLMTTGMMVRVSFGHTGRSVLQAPTRATAAFGLLVAGTLARVAGPWFDSGHTQIYILLAGLFWLLAMVLLLWLLLPILLRSRTASS